MTSWAKAVAVRTVRCSLCPFPCPPNDRLPMRGGGVAHAACAMGASLNVPTK